MLQTFLAGIGSFRGGNHNGHVTGERKALFLGLIGYCVIRIARELIVYFDEIRSQMFEVTYFLTRLARVGNWRPTAGIARRMRPVDDGEREVQTRTQNRARRDGLPPLDILKIREITEVIAHSCGPHIAKPGY